jgi:hypothetical protein
MMSPDEKSNFELFRDILTAPLIEKCSISPPNAQKKRKNRRRYPVVKAADVGNSNDAEDLAEFIDVRY